MKPLTQKSQNQKMEGVGVGKLEGLEVDNFCRIVVTENSRAE